MTTRYGIGIWGAGSVAKDHLRAYLANPACHIVAIGSLYLEDAQSLAQRVGSKCTCYTDYAAFLADPNIDVVSICTPHHLHADNTVMAAQAGKHVFIEKPLAVNLKALYKMQRAIREAAICSVTGFVVRWVPLVAHLRKMVREAAFGNVRVIDVDFWHARQRPTYYRQRKTGGSAMLLGGCHALDTAMFLMDAVPVEVIARSVQIGAESEEEYEFDCAELCLVRYSNGAVGRISAVVNGYMPYQFNIDVLGDLGSARNERIFLQGDAEQTGYRELPELGVEHFKATGLPYEGLIDHFLNCIKSGTESGVGIQHAVQVHEACFAALLSEHTGNPVKLPLSVTSQESIHRLLQDT